MIFISFQGNVRPSLTETDFTNDLTAKSKFL